MLSGRRMCNSHTPGNVSVSHLLIVTAFVGVLLPIISLGARVAENIHGHSSGQPTSNPPLASRQLAGVGTFVRQAASAGDDAVDLQKVGRFVRSAQALAMERAELATKFSNGRSRSGTFFEHVREVAAVFGPEWAMHFLDDKTRLGRSKTLRARIEIADVGGPNSKLWEQVAERILTSEARDKAELAIYAAQRSEHEEVQRAALKVTGSESIDALRNRFDAEPHGPRGPPARQVPDLRAFEDALQAGVLTDADLYFFGQLVADQDAYFKRIENLEQQRAYLRGALKLKDIYHDDARRSVLKSLTRSLRQHDSAGYFTSHKGTDILDELLSPIVELDASGGFLGTLYELLRNHPDDEIGRNTLNKLVDARNQRAIDLALDRLFGKSAVSQELSYRQHLLELLVQKKHLDGRLPKAVSDLLDEGAESATVFNVLRVVHQELGVLPDKDTLDWTWRLLKHEQPGLLAADASFEQIAQTVRQAITARRGELESLHALNSADRIEALLGSELSLLYFVIYGKRSAYSYYQRFGYPQFMEALHAAAQAEKHVDTTLFRSDAVPNKDWHEALLARQRPSDDLVWTVRLTDQPIGSAQTLANELRQVSTSLRAGLSEALGEGKLSSKSEGKLRKLLGEEVSSMLLDEVPGAASDADFSAIHTKLLFRLRQLRKQSRNADEKAKWQELVQHAEEDGPVLSLRHVPFVLAGEAQLSASSTSALNDLTGALRVLGDQLTELGDEADDVREVTLRYLDGNQDFLESLRFTDGARCCIVTRGKKDRKGILKAKMARDPHWFVVQVEDSSPDAAQRQISGFVFGSYGFVDDEPALVLNGVYMDVAEHQDKIVDAIYERIGRPAGIKRVAMAAINGGSWDPDGALWKRADGERLFRPRAIVDESGSPEKKIYDDISNVVNEEHKLKSKIWLRRYE